MSSQIYADRRVAVRIVASESQCGRCPQMRVDTRFCTLFGNSTNFESPKGKRLPECIAAEKALTDLEARAVRAPLRTREQQRMEITSKRTRFIEELARLKRELGRLPTKVELQKALGVSSRTVYKMGELLVERGMLPSGDFSVKRRNSGRKAQKTPTAREGGVLLLVWRVSTNEFKPSMRDIADHGGMSLSNAAAHVKRLRGKGYIEEASGRARNIQLTAKGRRWAYEHTQGR